MIFDDTVLTRQTVSDGKDHSHRNGNAALLAICVLWALLELIQAVWG